jgi:hypothetical protein
MYAYKVHREHLGYELFQPPVLLLTPFLELTWPADQSMPALPWDDLTLNPEHYIVNPSPNVEYTKPLGLSFVKLLVWVGTLPDGFAFRTRQEIIASRQSCLASRENPDVEEGGLIVTDSHGKGEPVESAGRTTDSHQEPLKTASSVPAAIIPSIAPGTTNTMTPAVADGNNHLEPDKTGVTAPAVVIPQTTLATTNNHAVAGAGDHHVIPSTVPATTTSTSDFASVATKSPEHAITGKADNSSMTPYASQHKEPNVDSSSESSAETAPSLSLMSPSESLYAKKPTNKRKRLGNARKSAK